MLQLLQEKSPKQPITQPSVLPKGARPRAPEQNTRNEWNTKIAALLNIQFLAHPMARACVLIKTRIAGSSCMHADPNGNVWFPLPR